MGNTDWRTEPTDVEKSVDELLNGEIFYSLKEAQIIIEKWRGHYNTMRPYSALGYRPPAAEAIVPVDDNIPLH